MRFQLFYNYLTNIYIQYFLSNERNFVPYPCHTTRSGFIRIKSTELLLKCIRNYRTRLDARGTVVFVWIADNSTRSWHITYLIIVFFVLNRQNYCWNVSGTIELDEMQREHYFLLDMLKILREVGISLIKLSFFSYWINRTIVEMYQEL